MYWFGVRKQASENTENHKSISILLVVISAQHHVSIRSYITARNYTAGEKLSHHPQADSRYADSGTKMTHFKFKIL